LALLVTATFAGLVLVGPAFLTPWGAREAKAKPVPAGPLGPRVAISEGVSVAIPPGFSREVREVPESGGRADLLQLTDGSDVLVIVVYRRDATRPAPTATEALEVHTAELALALGVTRGITTERLGLSVFDKRQPTSRLLTRTSATSPTARQAWVVAGEHVVPTRSKAKQGDTTHRTVVCSALTVLGSPNATLFEAVVASVSSR
jgi:hypothetical protein